MKTNAARILDRMGIPYALREYTVDPEELGAEVVAHDYAAVEAVKAKVGDACTFAESPEAAAQGADAVLIATEWPQYKAVDLEALGVKAKVMFDGRNLFRPEAMHSKGWSYHSLGRASV